MLLFGAVAAWLAIGYSGRIRDWGVMTDELLYVKLAISAIVRHSPLPFVHGQPVGVINQLYPLLLAPFFGTLSVPAAFHATHVLNAPLMASAAIPAYLLAREVVDRRAALAVALLSVVVPWMVLAGFLMTEVVAYPAFLWALLGLQRAVTQGAARRDLIALAGIALATLARVQFLLLVLVLPLAIVGHELGYAVATRSAVRGAAVAAWRRHRLLAALYGAAAVAALLAALLSSLSSGLGVYAPAVNRGSLLPAWVWQSAAAHIDSVAIGCGLVPLVLGGGWMLAALARPVTRQAHAFAILSLLAICSLTVESASFDLRFGGRDVVRDRYVFYVVPLLLAGTAAVLRERRAPWLAPAALTLLFAATVHWLEFPVVRGVWVDSPTRVLNNLIVEQAGSLGPKAFVASAGLLVGVCSVLALRLLPRLVFAPLVLVVLLAFSLFTTQRVIDHTLDSTGVSGRGMAKPPGIVLDWVDSVLPHGARAAILPFPTASGFASTAVSWWDVEFWNRSVRQAFVAADGDFRYTPFPTRRLEPDWRTGLVPGTAHAAPFVVAAKNDSRFGLAGDRYASNLGLTVLAAERPYRVDWMTRGLQSDGWTRPGRRATIRVFSAADRAQRATVSVSLAAPSTEGADYSIGALRARLAAGATATERIAVCVPSRSFADIGLESPTAARIPGPALSFAAPPIRRAGVNVLEIVVQRSGGACKGA